jgi:catechol 2,3-dioxygenase-like lactoylglutathione lyase family enzyme
MDAPALKVTGINHVVLYVTDVERSRRFYMDVLGFEDLNISVGGSRAMSFLRGGSQGLDLFEASEGDAHAGQEMNHMALVVEAADVDEASAALEKHGVDTSARSPRNTFFISDPDGHRIEILPRTAWVLTLDRDTAAAAN